MKLPKLNLKANKKIWLGAGTIIVIILLVVIFGHSKNTNATKGLPNFPVTSPEDISLINSKVNKNLTYAVVNSDPDKYKGQVIQWGGQVFVEPEKDNAGVYLQVMHTDSDNSFVVGYQKPDFQVKQDDYIIVTGVVSGKFEGENGFGAKLSKPLIKAGLIEQSTRSGTAESADLTIPVSQTNTQNGFMVTLDKIEVASAETRYFLTVKNNSSDKISFYTFDAKAIQGSKQFELKSIYDSNEEIPSEILPGVEAKGVLVSDPIDKSQKEISLILPKPYDSSFNNNWQDITFKVSLP